MQILIADPSLEIPLVCFTWGTWIQWGELGPGKAPLEQRQLKRTLCSLCVWTQITLCHRGLKITFWTVMEFSCVTTGGGTRDYGCCSSGAPWDLNHPLFALWEDFEYLLKPQHSSPAARCLPHHVAWRKLSSSSVLAHVHLSWAWWWAHVFYSHGQLQKSSVPLSHLLMKELKQW